MTTDRWTNFSAATRVVAAQGQISCNLEGTVAILNLESGVYFGLDEVGATVWEMIASPRRIDELCDALTQNFDVDPARCRRDLLALLSDLESHGLIEVSDEPDR